MIINIENLTVAYGGGSPILENLNLRLAPGGIVALCAPNGEGKTTLLKTIAGLTFPGSGRVIVMGQLPRDRSPELLEQLYYLPAEPSLPAWSGERIGRVYGSFYPNFSTEVFYECLEDFRIPPSQHMAKMSFGQQRRVQLAFALAVRTPLLLLDEPTLGLDIAGKDQFRRSLIRATEEGQTVIIATHLLSEVEPVLDRMLILHQRQIWTQVDLSTANRIFSFHLSPRPPQPGTNSYGRRVPGGWLIVRADGQPSSTRPDLETLYLALTEGKLVDPTPKVTVHV